MNKNKLIIGLLVGVALFGVTGCKKEKKGATPQEIQYAKNIKNVPKISKQTQKYIDKSYGTPLTKEEKANIKANTAEGQKADYSPLNSKSPGKNVPVQFATLSKKQLMKLSTEVQLTIFINGVIRDEYRVAANTLYGPEKVLAMKAKFKEALMKEAPKEEYNVQYSTMVDKLLGKLPLSSNKLFSSKIDEFISSLNMVYIQPTIGTDLGKKATINGNSKILKFVDTMAKMHADAENFVPFDLRTQYTALSDEEKQQIEEFYEQTYSVAVTDGKLATSDTTKVLGGFAVTEEGVWEPVDWNKFAFNYITVAFGI